MATLATDQGDNAVAVLLSGTGEDGIAGIQQIKAHGGMILIQNPDDAAHAALPRRGVAIREVDRVGTAGELSQHLVQSKGDLALSPLPVDQGQDNTLSQIFAAVLLEIVKQTGHDLSHYKPSTLQRRILRRMGMAGLSSLAQYLELLQAHPDETTALFRDCLVSVTSFFRDPDAYEMLERDCIPQLFLSKGRSDFVRVWVAGCATGEEAYSVAIQLAERAAQVNEPPRLQVFATDLDEEAIAIARRGLYPPTVAKDIAQTRLQRYFVEENGCYRVKPEIREHVLFAVHDLLKDPPFSRLDLICCRNVLIYFNREAQEKVFAIFHYALNNNGYLFLGTSESADAANDLFGVFNKHCHLYQRRDVIMAPQRRLGTPAATPATAPSGKPNERLAQRQADKPRTVEEMYTAWSLRIHTPPRLLVNENYDITHLFGGADRYFQERDGAITQNVLQKILPDLRLDLRAALYQAFNKGERTISRLLRVELPTQSQMLQLHVGPVMEPGFPQEYVEVVFVVQDDAALLGLPATDEALETDLSLVARMEEELLRTRERLQTIIEEYEVSGQELKASNEELQSINEELKSTTEELETSKEELQSMNEELITVNSELTRKIDELHRANSDLLNLVSSTDVGAIFLSSTLHIKRFTPRATDLFNLIEGDTGRPFAHVTHRLRHTGLQRMAAQVNATNERIEETVQRDDDRWFILRVFPYHTVSGENDGVVITFVDINDLKRAESEERQRRQQQSLAELSQQALTGSDLDALLTAAAHGVAEVLEMELCKILELQPNGKTLLLKAGVGWREGLVGHTIVPADTTSQAGYTLQSHAPVIVRDLQTETRFHSPALLTEHEVRSGIGVMIPAPDGVYGVLSVHSRQLRAFATYDVDYLQSVANLLAATIMRRRTEAAVRESEARFRVMADSAPVLIWVSGLDQGCTFFNKAWLEFTGRTMTQELGAGWGQGIHPDDLECRLSTYTAAFAARQDFALEYRLRRHDGSYRWVLDKGTPRWAPDGSFAGFIGGCIDIHDRKAAEVLLTRYQLLSDQARDIILFLRLDGQIIEANTAAVEAYGYDRASLLRMKIHDLRDPATLPFVTTQIEQANQEEGGRGVRFETVHRRRDGRTFPVEVSSIGADMGGERLLMSVIRDISERKATEAALAASEAKFATAFSLSPLILTITSLQDGRLIEVNESFVRITGYPRAEALGRTPDELDLWANPQARATGLARLAAGDIVENVEALFRMKNGELRTCLLGATLVEINGQPCALTALTDITERKATEAALRQSEERFVTIFRHSPYPIAILSLADGCYVDVNPTWERDTGYTYAEVVGRKPAELGLQAEPPLRLIEQLQEEGVLRDVEIQTRMRNGHQRTALMSAELIQLNGESHALLVFTDITERKAAEAALQASETQLRLVTDNITGLTSYVDCEERYRFVNAAYERWFAQPRERLIGLSVREAIGDPAYAQVQPYIVRALTGERIRFESTLSYADGATRTVMVTYVPDVDDEEQVLGFYALVTDITERKQAEERLQFLAEASTMLASSLDYTATLENVARAAVPSIADWCAIDLIDEDGSFEEGIIAHIDPERVRWAEELRRRYPIDPNAPVGAPHVIRTGQSEIYPEISDEMLQAVAKNEEELQLLRSVGYRSLIIAPLKTHGRVLGAITFVAAETERHFDPTDLTMAEELAQRAAAAIGNAQLHRAVQQREQQLRHSEEEIQRLNRDLKLWLDELQTLLDVVSIGIFVAHDPACQVITSNPAGARMLGAAHTENTSKSRPDGDQLPFRVMQNGREVPSAELPMQYAVANDVAIKNVEYDVIRSDGSVINLYEYAIPLHDEENNVRGGLGIFVDITERKQAEESLRESEERFRSTFEQAAVGMAHLAIDGRYLRVNDRLCEILGYSRAELLQKSFMDVTHPTDLGADLAQMERQLAGEIIHHSMEKRYIRKDGATVWANMTASVVRDDAGTPKYGIVVIEEISARKAAEEERARLATQIAMEQQRLAVILEHLPAGVLIAEATGDLILSNPEVDRIFKHPFRTTPDMAGYQEGQLFDPLTGEKFPLERMPMVRTLTTGETVLGEELKILRGDGTWGYASVNSAPVRGEDGQVVLGVAAFIDTTARRQAEEELRQLNATLNQRVAERTAELERSNQELDQFAYVASHDLKAPLRAIVNLASWIDEDAGALLPAPSLEHLQKLRGRALRMERLLDDLLTYSRIGRRDGVIEEVKTEALVQDAIYLLAPPSGFTLKVDGELPILLTPRTPLELVFRNLISNAIKHHHQPGQGMIQIQARDLGDFLEFEIRDNGPGIEPQYHERIFGMFQTLRPRDEVEGSGMGLAIAKRAIEYRGGVIRIESTVGQGTTFCFTWPKKAVDNEET
ncbi:MAG: PAS domain S-box protein [Caldilineaceae bacterium]